MNIHALFAQPFIKRKKDTTVSLYFFFSFLCSLSPIISSSQGFQWLQNGGGNNTLSGRVEEVVAMTTDNQQNVYVISAISRDGVMLDGNSVSTYESIASNSSYNDFILVSYTCDGNYRWHKVFGGGGTDLLSGVGTDNQNNIYVSGRFNQCFNDDGSYPLYSIPRIGDNQGIDYTSQNTQSSCQRIFLAKFDSEGIFQWIHYPHEPLNVAETNAGSLQNFYVVNDSIYWLVSLPPGSYEQGAFANTRTDLPFLYYVLQYDTNAGFVSATPFDLELSAYPSLAPRWFRNPYNGSFYARYSNTNNITATAGGNSLNASLPKIICFNSQGQYLWHRESSGSTLTFGSSGGLDFDSDNNIYLAGTASNFISDSFLGWTLPGSNTGYSTFLMKCNPKMTSYDWVTYHSPGSANGNNQVLFTPSKIFLTGAINQNPITWGTQTLAGPGPNNSFDPLLASFNPQTGDCTDLYRLPGSNGYQDSFTSITQDNAGDIILGGFMGLDLTDAHGTTHYTNGGNSDFFVTKFAAQDCTPLHADSFQKSGIAVFPNPVKEICTVAIDYKSPFKIYNLLGVEVLRGYIDLSKQTIDLSQLSQGYYLLQINTKTGEKTSVKILKE